MPLINKRLIKISGFTLPELMIALLVNSILLIGLIAAFVANLDHYNKVLNTNRLNHQLQSTLRIISNDIRRAGYWANAKSNLGSSSNSNPFMAAATDIATNASNNCILFAYDHNSDGSLPSISTTYDDERYGYRLNAQTIQARPPGASFSCAASASSWDNVTDPNIIQITNLSFIITQQTLLTGPGSAAISLRSVDITITGRLASDTTVTKTLTQHVRIRNDKYI